MRAPAFYFQRPGLRSFILLPFAIVYGAVAARRMGLPGERAGVPVICIGNPTLGGAGKTPTAIAIAQMLAAMGEKPVFLSRGYGGSHAGPVTVDGGGQSATSVGDEPLLLVRHFPTVVARDRVAGARLAAAQGASVLVMDDGFQNPSLSKDCSLLVVDATVGTGNNDVFPAGPLRAPLAAQLAQAEAVVRVGAGDASRLLEDQAGAMGLPVFTASLVPDAKAAASLKGRKLLAFAGIGRPEKFFATLREIGAQVIEARSFGDHHRYTAHDAGALLGAAEAQRLTLATTEKDMVRMQGDPALAELSAAAKALPVELQFADREAVRRLLDRALKRARG
jgi:tetraacyldisaccharide 4'-kinase